MLWIATEAPPKWVVDVLGWSMFALPLVAIASRYVLEPSSLRWPRMLALGALYAVGTPVMVLTPIHGWIAILASILLTFWLWPRMTRRNSVFLLGILSLGLGLIIIVAALIPPIGINYYSAICAVVFVFAGISALKHGDLIARSKRADDCG